MNEELQAALFTLVTAGLAPWPVYGAAPQDTAYPYVVVGEPETSPRNTDSSVGVLLTVRVRHFGRSGAVQESNEFLDRVRELLHHQESTLALTNAEAVTMYIDGTSVEEPSEEGKARETSATVAILIDDVTDGTN